MHDNKFEKATRYNSSGFIPFTRKTNINAFQTIYFSIEVDLLMIQAELYEMAGNTELSQTFKNEASMSTEQLGYHHSLGSVEPSFLGRYPELRESWDFGVDQKCFHQEIDNCEQCNDATTYLCMRHDY